MRYVVGYVLALFALMLGAHVLAAPVARNEAGDTVRLSVNECHPEIRQRLPESVRDIAKSASAVIGGRVYKACWILQGDGVVLQYDDGDQGFVPLAAFKDEPGV